MIRLFVAGWWRLVVRLAWGRLRTKARIRLLFSNPEFAAAMRSLRD